MCFLSVCVCVFGQSHESSAWYFQKNYLNAEKQCGQTCQGAGALKKYTSKICKNVCVFMYMTIRSQTSGFIVTEVSLLILLV